MESSPILIVPYMWIGDFVRCHSVVTLLRPTLSRPAGRSCWRRRSARRWPITCRASATGDRLRPAAQPAGALAQQTALAERLKREGYGTALMMPRTWKSALAPFLAGIPERVGFAGEARFFLLNDLRFGERKLPRMVDRCAMLALPRGAEQPAQWPLPELKVAAAEAAAWRERRGLPANGRPVVALAPGAVGPSKRWPAASYAALARRAYRRRFFGLGAGRPRRKSPGRRDRRRQRGPRSHRQPTCATPSSRSPPPRSPSPTIRACSTSPRRSGTPSIGIFGPTSPWHWAPLNPLAAVIETDDGTRLPAMPQAGLPPRSSPLHARHRARNRSWPRPAVRSPRPPRRPATCRHNDRVHQIGVWAVA